MKIFIQCVAGGAALLLGLSAQGQTIFVENFESGLGGWTGKGGGAHHGATTADPLASGQGNVLNFTALNFGGDIYSTQLVSYNGPLVLSFDYLGMPSPYGTPGDLGGFIGIAYTLNPLYLGSDHLWFAGTQFNYGVVTELIDDGAWHHYNISLDGAALGAFHLMIQDYDNSGGIPGDAYFDNVTVSVVPEPSTLPLLILSGGLVGFIQRRRDP